MTDCWSINPEERPKFTELRTIFDQMISTETDAHYIELSVDLTQPYYNLIDEDFLALISEEEPIQVLSL